MPGGKSWPLNTRPWLPTSKSWPLNFRRMQVHLQETGDRNQPSVRFYCPLPTTTSHALIFCCLSLSPLASAAAATGGGSGEPSIGGMRLMSPNVDNGHPLFGGAHAAFVRSCGAWPMCMILETPSTIFALASAFGHALKLHFDDPTSPPQIPFRSCVSIYQYRPHDPPPHPCCST